MKKVILICSCYALLTACGGNNASSGNNAKADTASAAPAAPATSSADEKGLELIGQNDCTTCHRLEKTSPGATIGPAYSDVAARYAPGADTTVDRLVQKIIKGGSGDWGTVPMTGHPALAPADVKVMVKYILSLKK